MTANVNLDPYNRKDNPVASLWSVADEVFMEQSVNGSKLFEHVPEGTYLFEYDGETCSVDDWMPLNSLHRMGMAFMMSG